jgi:uncharacterized protein (TIGR02246 family)
MPSLPQAPLNADAVEEAFYDAMRRGDLAAMMALWADDEEVICIHPSGPRHVGLDAVRASWEAIFSNGGIDVRVRAIRAHAGAVLAVHSVIETISIQGQGGVQAVECVATNVFVKSASGWRLLIHHATQADEDDTPAAVPTGAVLH